MPPRAAAAYTVSGFASEEDWFDYRLEHGPASSLVSTLRDGVWDPERECL